MTVSVRPFPNTALAAAIALLLGCAFAGHALAQEEGEQQPRSKPVVGSYGAAQAAERARQRKAAQEAKASQAAQGPQLFPLATRKVEPQNNSAADVKTANEIRQAFDAGNYEDVVARTDAYVATSKNAYLISYFYQLAGSSESKLGDKDKAIAYYRKAVETNGFDNNGHYQTMLILASELAQQKQDAEALTWVEKFLAETKAETQDALKVKAVVLSDLGRDQEAAATYEKVLAAHPDDQTTMMNAVTFYRKAGQDQKATELLNRARGSGKLQSADQYQVLFNGYIKAQAYGDAENVLLEGVNSGVIKPSPKLVKDYWLLAQGFYDAADFTKAAEYYGRAAQIDETGESALNQAKVLRNDDRIAEAKAAARLALAKGVKQPKQANDILALPGK